MKQCPHCGAQIADDSRFCSECGKEIPQGIVCPHCGASVKESDSFCQNCGRNLSDGSYADNSHVNEIIQEDEEESRWNWISYIIGAIALLAICGGGWWYWDSSNKRVAREKAIADSLEIVRQDSIKLAREKEKEAEMALRKKQMPIPMDVVLDLYKHISDKDYIIKKLQEYSYSFYTSYENGEYWTKDVNLKKCKDWRDYTYYEATERKGSSVLIFEGGFSVTVYAHKDFLEWEKQLQELGYRYQEYGDDLPEENGWTALGAHGNLCRQYVNGNGSVIEFMKDGDGHPGYNIYFTDDNYHSYETTNSDVDSQNLDWLQGHWVYEQGSYKGHFIIQGDKITQYSSMNPERETSTFRIEGDELLSRIANGLDLTVKIDFANHTIDYGDGCWMHKVE